MDNATKTFEWSGKINDNQVRGEYKIDGNRPIYFWGIITPDKNSIVGNWGYQRKKREGTYR